MQASRTTTHAHTLCRIVASFALLSTLMACGYKGPLYMPAPPAPDAALTTPPTPAAPLTPEASGKAGETATPRPVPAQ